MTPAYFDFLIEAFRRGYAGRNVHLGFWERPPPLSAPMTPGEFEAAQQRLTDLVAALGELPEGGEALDVGCGFGGLLATLARAPGVRLTGLGNDPRQLEICGSLGGGASLVAGDACALPFAAERFDRVFCLEAMFHFRSRAAFLMEAARVLKPGGKLVLTDILLAPPDVSARISVAAVETLIRANYGPWPETWATADALTNAARSAGLAPEFSRDLRRETLPSYRATSPRLWNGDPANADAGTLLRWLHETDRLTYAVMRLRKI